MTDDGGLVDYDPTNGTRSAGDLVIRIPTEREYPFPREGVRAKDASDVLAQFPKGLPLDVFSGKGSNVALSIVESSTGSPVRIFSFGPTGDEESWKDNLRTYRPPGMMPFDWRPEINSNLPRWQGAPIQKVYDWRAPDSPTDEWTLGPRYEPTNGTKSEGQVSIDLPE
jgi:hypothetical protein